MYVLLAVGLTSTAAHAQSNADWDLAWKRLQPSLDTSSSNFAWMDDAKNYTGIAYDKWNDVLYVVSPEMCQAPAPVGPCPKIHALDAATGNIAHRIGDPQVATGRLNTDPNIIWGSHAQGRFALYRIDLDDEGRIFACNTLSPLWGICYPGPPPNCNRDFLAQGPLKFYRWDTHDAEPELVYQTAGSGPTNSSLEFTPWGTSFDVVGQRHQVIIDNDTTVQDSVRIFVSGGKFFSGSVLPTGEIAVIVQDDDPNAPRDYMVGLYLHLPNHLRGAAAHGIAATGTSFDSPLWIDSNFGAVMQISQHQDPQMPLPQHDTISILQTLPTNVTGPSGTLAYIEPFPWNYPFLFVADGLNSSSQL